MAGDLKSGIVELRSIKFVVFTLNCITNQNYANLTTCYFQANTEP
jgi:hypothetical protein